MQIPNSRKAIQFYKHTRTRNGRSEFDVDDNAVVHAVLLDHPRSYKRWRTSELRHMWETKYLRRDDSVEAVCGLSVRVIYTMSFDTTPDEVCRECKGLLTTRTLLGEDEFWNQVDEAAHRHYQRELERERRRARKIGAQQLARDLEAAPIEDSDIPEGVEPYDSSTWMFPALHPKDSKDDEYTA